MITPLTLSQSNSAPRLWLTSMSGPDNIQNMTEMIEPILQWLDGIIWVLNDVPADDPGARYLETVKGAGRVVHRGWTQRHWHCMNDTLFTGLIEEGDLVLWTDPLEQPRPPFVSRVKTEIAHFMQEADVDVVAYYGKPFLMRYRETLEYRGSPHWSIQGTNGRAVEWSTIEPDEKKVRFNVRPLRRTDPFHWVSHYLRYGLYPAGSNSFLLGLDTYGDPATLFPPRETKRLAFRQEMKRRGFPLTVEGFKAMCNAPNQPDEVLKQWLRGDKVWSDAYHYLVCGRTDVIHSHKPSDALPIP